MVLNNISGFLQHYIIEPIRLDSGYNIVNTALIAGLFVLAAWLLWDKIFRKKQLPIDNSFVLASSGWVLFGSTARVLEDAGIVSSPLLITPIIYIWIGLLAVGLLAAARKIDEKYGIAYWKMWGAVGFLLGVVNLALFRYSKPHVLALIGLGMAIWVAIIVLAGKKTKLFRSQWNQATLLAQLWDGTSSFIGITFFGYWEKHLLGRSLIEFFEGHNLLLINNSAAWTLMLMKLAVISAALYFIDKDCHDEHERKFFKLLILLLGLILGLRNSLQLAVLG